MWQLGLTVFLQLMGVILDYYKASNDTKRAFFALVQAVKDDGLISVKAHDEFERQKEVLLGKK